MHYICTGGCGGVSDKPGVCQATTCPLHNHPLQPCDCKDGKHGAKPEHHVDVLTVGLAAGVALSLYVFAMGLISMVSGRGRGIVGLLSEWYVGFSASILGSFIGALWGFADGFLTGLLIAWIYNKVRKMRK